MIMANNRMAIATFLLVSLSLSAFGEQRKEEQLDKLLQQRIEFIISKIELTEEEKEKFIPLYEEFQGKQVNLFKKSDRKANFKEEKNYTEEDYRKKNESYYNEKLERATLDRVYYERLKIILPESKIYNLNKAERAYKHDLLRQVRNKRNENTTTTPQGKTTPATTPSSIKNK